MLMHLHLNDQADVDAYTRDIRNWLAFSGGRPRTGRRAIADQQGTTSLLSSGARKQLGVAA
jgi:hypothetical protein